MKSYVTVIDKHGGERSAGSLGRSVGARRLARWQLCFCGAVNRHLLPAILSGAPAGIRAGALLSIDKRDAEPLTLKALSTETGVSAQHLQRTFKQLMGITPRQYAESRRLHRFKAHVRNGASVTEALYEAGYGSSRGLYEKSSARLGMTPATYGRGGRGMRIIYTIARCPLGRLLVAATERGVCAVALGDSDTELERSLFAEYSNAAIDSKDTLVSPS